MPAPVIWPYDPAWGTIASGWLDRIRVSLNGLADHENFEFDHIGSTAVPGLGAKPIIDLQLRAPRLPAVAELEAALAPLGFSVAHGSRADSPGVYFDNPRPGADQDPEKYRKHLFFRPGGDDELAVILHVRRSDSPFAAFVLNFRDWLRANPIDAQRYETQKRMLAAEHADANDYDDYTRAKTAFLDDIQQRLDRWSADSKAPRSPEAGAVLQPPDRIAPGP
jgi:GrpB-like predicted nucleotidyltransferase (UPF0157 family)